jgi:hypothetical protein
MHFQRFPDRRKVRYANLVTRRIDPSAFRALECCESGDKGRAADEPQGSGPSGARRAHQ